MAYFNHAFVKCFNPSKIQLEKGLATKDLAAGQIGLVDDKTWKTVKHNDAASAEGLLYLVQGSYHNVVGGDTIGNNPGHGGYAESVKSKGINPKYITRLWSEECVVPTQSETCISVGPKCAPCGSALFLRLDVKGRKPRKAREIKASLFEKMPFELFYKSLECLVGIGHLKPRKLVRVGI